ncbi:hypothetical protein ACJZ2D_016258 [Fusarium nematophilum]
MAGSLQGIEQNLNSINSRGDYFPQHVYSYVKMMIERHAHDDAEHISVDFTNDPQELARVLKDRGVEA